MCCCWGTHDGAWYQNFTQIDALNLLGTLVEFKYNEEMMHPFEQAAHFSTTQVSSTWNSPSGTFLRNNCFASFPQNNRSKNIATPSPKQFRCKIVYLHSRGILTFSCVCYIMCKDISRRGVQYMLPLCSEVKTVDVWSRRGSFV